MKTYLRMLAFLLLSWCVAAKAYGQTITPQDLPGSVDPGRIRNQLSLSPSESEVVPVKRPSGIALSNAPPGAEKIYLVLKSLRIEGMTAYPQDEMAELYAHLLGRRISLSEIYYVAAQITKRYRDDGYLTSRVIVPPQTIAQGEVRIAVVEGYVNAVNVQGDYHETRVTRGILDNLRAMRPLNAKTLERYMLLLNNLSGLKARAVLESPAQDAETGALDVRVIFERRSSTYAASVDNYGTLYLGPLQFGLRGLLADISNTYDQLNLSLFSTDQWREFKYLSAQYVLPLMANGLSMALDLSYNKALPAYTLEQYDLRNSGVSGGVSFSYPVIRARDQNLTFNTAFEFKNVSSDIFGSQLYNDRIRTASVSFAYDVADDWLGVNTFQLGLTHGLDVFGARPTGSRNLSRSQGHSDYMAVKASYTRQQRITQDFDTKMSVAGQYTNVPLLSSERFGYGGQAFGRAYDASEITGDSGVAAAIELRYKGLGKFYDALNLEPFAFYDVGKVWNNERGGEPASGASAGLGVRMDVGSNILTAFTVAKPLTRNVAASPRHSPDDWRLFFSMTYKTN